MSLAKQPSFDVIYDIAVLHTIRDVKLRKEFAGAIKKQLAPNGMWFNVSCISPDIEHIADQYGIEAPPGLTYDELAECTQDIFDITHQQELPYRIDRNGQIAPFPAVFSIFSSSS